MDQTYERKKLQEIEQKAAEAMTLLEELHLQLSMLELEIKLLNHLLNE